MIVEAAEPAAVTAAIENEQLCPYCEKPLSEEPATPFGLHVSCADRFNAEMEEIYGPVD